jgi:proline dehydrogenase
VPFVRDTLIALSRSPSLRRFAEQSALGQKLSSRFVAGVSCEAAIRVTEELNRDGFAVTLDSLGENVATNDEARRAADLYHVLLNRIGDRGLNANVSVKLTQMGLDLDRCLATHLVDGLIEHAADVNSFVRIDMEGSEYTQTTLEIVRCLHGKDGFAGRVGAVIQSYLFRSEQDVAGLTSLGIRIRLCKGAYREPRTVAFRHKRDVDDNYVRLMQKLLLSGVFHGIATHDEAMIRATIDFARQHNIPKSSFEFQMLYGIRRDLQRALVNEGYGMRIYVPFGDAWYPYVMRRLAERPANLIFLAKNLLR